MLLPKTWFSAHRFMFKTKKRRGADIWNVLPKFMCVQEKMRQLYGRQIHRKLINTEKLQPTQKFSKWTMIGGCKRAQKYSTSFPLFLYSFCSIFFLPLSESKGLRHGICSRQGGHRETFSRNPFHEDQPSHTLNEAQPHEKKIWDFYLWLEFWVAVAMVI